jgi:hypothetical protein
MNPVEQLSQDELAGVPGRKIAANPAMAESANSNRSHPRNGIPAAWNNVFMTRMAAKTQIVVSGGFDDLKSRDLRFLEEASKLGELSVLLWPDAMLQKLTGKAPKFSLGTALFSERRALRQPSD